MTVYPAASQEGAAYESPAAPRHPATSRRRRRRVPGGAPARPAPGSVAEQQPEADLVAVARSLCLRQLTMGPRSRGQLAAVLTRRGITDDVAERVLDRLTEVGLIDDAAFAELWVRSRSGSRGLSRRAIAAELHARGVSDEVAGAALGVRSAEDDAAAARSLVDRRVGGTRALGHEVRVRRLVAMLGRKGYPGGLALRVVREALAADGADAALAADAADAALAALLADAAEPP